MPNDLYYFYESDFSKGDLVNFSNSLPSHVRPMFRQSMGGLSVLDRDSLNVIQGYRGPKNNGSSGDSAYLGPINGLQEVKFWWGVSKHVNWVPIAGNLTFLVGRAFSDTAWHSLFFDSTTGECLSHNKNEAADKLNNKGHQMFGEQKFEEASEYFNNAYQSCSSGYSSKILFKTNRDLAKSEILRVEGDRLAELKQYDTAILKYHAAMNVCPESKQTMKDKLKNREAEALNQQGNDFFEVLNYQQAADKQNEAYNKCTNGYKNEIIFKTNRDLAKSEVLRVEGDQLVNQKQYEAGIEKYQAALNICPDSKQATIDTLKNKEANVLNLQAITFLNDKNYGKAAEKFDAAFKKCSNEYKDKQIFRENCTKSITLSRMSNLTKQGDNYFNTKNYEKSIESYQEAINISQGCDVETLRSLTQELATITNNLAESFNSSGMELMDKNEFSKAFDKFDEAFKSCTNDYKNETLFDSNRNHAKAELIYLEALQLYSDENYMEATTKTKEALKICPRNKVKTIIKIKNTEAISLNCLGVDKWNKNDMKGACKLFKEAFTKCSTDHHLKQTFNDNFNHATAIMLNSEGFDLHNRKLFDNAISKYQKAYEVCPKQIASDLNTFRNNEVESIFQLGMELFRQKNYAEALNKFKSSNETSLGSEKKQTYEEYFELTQAKIIEATGDMLFQQEDFDGALEKFKEAYLMCPKSQSNALNGFINSQAKTLIAQSKKLWNAGWAAEKQENTSEAKVKFQSARKLSRKACELALGNKDYENWHKIFSFKIEGNEIFNEGIELQELADELQQQQKYREALMKYLEAKEIYQRGFDMSQDPRFQECINIVKESIETIENMEDEHERESLVIEEQSVVNDIDFQFSHIL